MRNKKLLLILFCFLITIIIGIMSYFAIEKKHTDFKVETMEVSEILTKKEIKEGLQFKTKEDNDKTYIYISLKGEQSNQKKNIDFNIIDIKETEDEITIYAKETGHCTPQYFVKHKMLGFIYGKGTYVSYFIDIHRHKIISIKKTNKTIEVTWKEHISC